MNMVQNDDAAQLQSSGVDRNRTPRGGRSAHAFGNRGGKGNRKLQLTGPPQLALPGPATLPQPTPKANPKSKGNAKSKRQEARPTSTSILRMAPPRPPQRRHRRCQHAPPESRQRCLPRLSRRQLPTRFLVHTPTRLHWMRSSTWVQPVPVFPPEPQCHSPLNTYLLRPPPSRTPLS